MAAPPMLCGDEVKAAVVDIGSSLCRFGTAGEDLPRHLFRSDIGVAEDSDDSDHKIGDVSLRFVQSDVSIESVIGPDGTTDWDNYASLMNYGLEECMKIDTTEYPLMVSNSDYTNYLKSSENILELCFENLQSPTVYAAAGAMLSSFSTGRPTSLVIDFGAQATRIIPIIDGFTLNKAIVSTSRGGNWIDAEVRKEIDKSGAVLKPWFEVDGRNYPKPTSSFREMHVHDVVKDLKHWMSFIPYKPVEEIYRAGFMAQLTIPPYELPDGTKINNNENICTAAEKWFLPTKDKINVINSTTSVNINGSSSSANGHVSTSANSGTNKTPSGVAGIPSSSAEIDCDTEPLHNLVHHCLSKCDNDVRKDLMANIVLVGGGSLIDGVSNRLTYELNEIISSNMKVKVVSSSPLERHHASWLGGSILSICGSFQQLWITKSEYQEYGSVSLAQHRLKY